jgi:hypothetical protein
MSTKQQSPYTIPVRSVRIAQIVSLVFAVLELGAATLLLAYTDKIVLVVILAIVGLITLVRVFTYPFEYRRKWLEQHHRRPTSGCTRTAAPRCSFDAPGLSHAGLAASARCRRRSVIRVVKPRRTMRQKTYLNPAEQWDRSVAVVQAAPRNLVYRKELGDGLFIGRVVASHRLFCAGDVVFVYISNGMAERQPVWAVSSKGYRIKNFYMQYHRCRELFDAGPLRSVELPGHLAGRKPDDPDVRQFVVGTLRAGDSAAR